MHTDRKISAMAKFVCNSVLIVLPFLVVGLIGGFIFDNLVWALFVATVAFIFVQLFYFYRFQQWAERRSEDLPIGLNRLWKPLYLLFRDSQHQAQEKSVVVFDKLASATDEGGYGLIIVDGRTIAWMNKTAVDLLQLDSERDVGSDITYLLRDPQFLDSFDSKQFNYEIEIETRDPPVGIFMMPYGEQHTLIMIHNLSQFLRAKNSSQELISNVSHELRSPLTVIQGYFDVLTDMTAEIKDPKLVTVLENMSQQITQMKNLIDDTLSIGWLENTELKDEDQQDVNVPVLLQNLLSELEKSNEKADCHFNKKIEKFGLRGNLSELQSAFMNLLDNAQRHSHGSEITVRWVHVGDEVCFEVSDQGDGIEAHHLPYLTNRFYRIDRARSREAGGTGLGLAIVKKILERHQGRLTIVSELGKGSCFGCYFPMTRVVSANDLPKATSDILLS